MLEPIRSVPMANYLTYSARNGNLNWHTFSRVLTGLKKAKVLTEAIQYENQGRHDLLLGALGAVGLVAYAYISTRLGLSSANEVFLVAGVSGSRKSKKFKGGLVVTRNPDGTGEFSIDGIGPAGGGLTEEVTREFFRRPTRANKKRINDITAQINNLNRQTGRARMGAERSAILDRIIELQNERDSLQ
ncbi:hypothetical protein CO005_02470 [Candidatus Roizmanbacteria bacterium CG_4_8_14_3_um_filter_34_9]|uniref:Uncharacterized protein n=1 Tax=Candidatus Roizmanbacteria bacterium CG_4_8_14_3_um_filter_34_9 TaxID=1974832 RepID=A0A2M7IC82_9BACT|nr:MAG: hypothetical protein CO005_02470 [Candidatus Roizmanbacteria bacterium CG_4_8_14_3_um_filter_34_9]